MQQLTVMRVCGTLTFLANGFGMGVWSVEIAKVQSVTGASDFAIGIGLLIFALVALVAMQISSRLSRRYPVNYVCAGLGLGFSVTLTILGFAPSVTFLFVALGLFGFAHGALDVAMNSRASMIENRAGRPMMSSFHAAWSIGGAIGAGAAGLLTGQGYGSELVLPLAAAIALPGLLIAIGGHQSPKPAVLPSNDSESMTLQGSMNLRLIGLCFIAFLALLTEGALANWSSIYLKGALTGLSGGFAVGYFAFSSGMSIGRLGGDWVVDQFGRRSVGVTGALVAAASFALVLWYPTLVTACVCFALIGLGMSNVVPITFSIAGRTAESEAVGISRAASSGYTGFVVGPPLIGGLASLSSLPMALTILVVTTLLIAILGSLSFEPRARSFRQGDRIYD